MINNYSSAFPTATDRDSHGNVTSYGMSGLTQQQYAEIHLMAGLLSNFEFVSGKNEFEIASKAMSIVRACIQSIS